MKILLLEDDLELCKNIKISLEKENYMVDCCNDGETAMLYALNTDYAYDLAIVDRMLPIIDGLTIIKSMRRKGISIPILIITAMSTLDNRVEGLDGGADDYLVKPFHIKELLARVSIYGFLGPNGAGKSTTMKMLLGLTAPTDGEFQIDNMTFPNDRVRILKEVGSFIESPSFYPNLTGRENLDIIRRILELPASSVDKALELVGL